MKCIICGQEIPQGETEMLFLSDSVSGRWKRLTYNIACCSTSISTPKICEDCFDIIAEGKKNRR